MIPERVVLLTTVIAIAVVMVASGPLIPGVGFTAETTQVGPDYQGFGQGAAEMGAEKRLTFGKTSLPADGRLASADGGYRVDLDSAELPVEAGDRPVTFHYAVKIPALGIVDEATERIPAGTARTARIEAPAGTVPADRVTEDGYEATLILSVEGDDWSGTVVEETVVLEVER
jgi:hypothetical protein